MSKTRGGKPKARTDYGEVRVPVNVCFHGQPVGGELRTDSESTRAAWVRSEDLDGYDIHPAILRRISHACAALVLTSTELPSAAVMARRSEISVPSPSTEGPGPVSVLPNDYDSDPDRFLSTEKHPHDDVRPYVAARFGAAGARTVLDVGGGNGRLARLLPGLSMRCLLLDLSPAMLELAPRPKTRADGARLPAADASVDAVAALFTLYHYDDPLVPVREARRVLRPGGMFAACAANRDSDPELAHVIPGWGAASTFDGEDAAAIVASVFAAPGDTVRADPWDGPLVTLRSVPDAVACLRVYGLTVAAASDAAATLDLPLTLTKRGCVIYATKDPGR